MRMVIDGTPELAQVICLTEVRSRYSLGKCKHRRLLVDQDNAFVECKDCGEKLNPIAMLSRFANEETRWNMERENLNKALEKFREKSRCKCQHCGKMTRIPT